MIEKQESARERGEMRKGGRVKNENCEGEGKTRKRAWGVGDEKSDGRGKTKTTRRGENEKNEARSATWRGAVMN